MLTKQGVIAGVNYRFPEGIATLFFEDGQSVWVEAGYGLRSLASCFGASEGEGDLNQKISGQEIVYTVDDMGVLFGFTPVAQWDGPEIPEEGIEEDQLLCRNCAEEEDHD